MTGPDQIWVSYSRRQLAEQERTNRFYGDDAQPLLLRLAQTKSGSVIAEGNLLSKKEQTEEDEDDGCYDFWGAALRSCLIRLTMQLLEMRRISVATNDKQIVLKVDRVSQVLADVAAFSPEPGW